jgi:hypothetical protein
MIPSPARYAASSLARVDSAGRPDALVIPDVRRPARGAKPPMARRTAPALGSQPRPTNGILVAMIVRNRTFASRGRLAM